MGEPERKSFLDVLKRNLSLADRSVFTTRFVYLGEYKGSETDLHKKMKENVQKLNENGEIILSGFLLTYPRFFLHIIEASEEVICRHLTGLLFESSDKIIGRAIPLPAYQNVYKMYFTSWYFAHVTNPPSLLNKIENVDIGEVQSQIKNCLQKMYLLSQDIMAIASKSHEKINEILKTLEKTVPYHLPEITTVEYLLFVHSPVIGDVREYLEEFSKIPSIIIYKDRVWPPTADFVPHLQNRLDNTSKQV